MNRRRVQDEWVTGAVYRLGRRMKSHMTDCTECRFRKIWPSRQRTELLWHISLFRRVGHHHTLSLWARPHKLTQNRTGAGTTKRHSFPPTYAHQFSKLVPVNPLHRRSAHRGRRRLRHSVARTCGPFSYHSKNVTKQRRTGSGGHTESHVINSTR